MHPSRPDPRPLPGEPPAPAPVDRPAAARLVAARFATDLGRAVGEYARLTGRPDPCGLEERVELEEELLALLPAYRRLTHDAASEYRLFIDPDRGPDEDSAPATDHDPQHRAYRTYLGLVRGGGLSRRAALTEVCARFPFADEAAALAALRAEREAVIRRWQQSAPCMVQALLDERWRGLLPED